jgi:nucleoside-diphosphate-sugar epimerase
MNPQRIFVTGGAGFLGRALVCELLAQGLAVRCLVRHADAATRVLDAVALGGENPERVELVVASLRDEPVDPRWLTDCDAVVHAAGALRGAPSVLVRENVVATRALVDAALTCGIRRFVLVSSLCVYAPHSLPAESVIDETCPVEPAPERRGAYVYSKVIQEAVCRDASRDRGLPLVVIRPGVIFGPGRSLLSDRVGLRLGRLLVLVGPGRRLPYTFVANCASALAAAVRATGIEGETFNIVDDQMPTARQLVDVYQQSAGDLRVVAVPCWAATSLSTLYAHWHARAPGQLPSSLLPYATAPLYKRVRFSTTAAKTRLRWQPRVDLLTALRMTTTATVEGDSNHVRRDARYRACPSVLTPRLGSPPAASTAESAHILLRLHVPGECPRGMGL